MAFGLEVVILLEIDLPTIRTEAYDDNKNSEVLGQDLGPNWEGLYKITKLADKGTFLRTSRASKSKTLEFQQLKKILPIKYNFSLLSLYLQNLHIGFLDIIRTLYLPYFIKYKYLNYASKLITL